MAKIKIEIKSRWTGSVLFEYEKENANLKEAVVEAVNGGANLEGAYLRGANLEGANLEGANLEGANLRGANLRGANLEGANLEGANLRGANLRGANLRGANLRGANLEGANLRGANLEGANLEGANLEGANLEGANLEGANLEGANLEGADLESIKNDLFAVLLPAIPEIPNLKKAIIDGRIDGSTYEGECACLCGTIMKSSNAAIANKIDSIKDSSRPIERFFLAIKKGDTPETNPFAKIALEWIEEFEGYINLNP